MIELERRWNDRPRKLQHDLLGRDLVDQLIGVIDLMGTRAVRAVAGNRDSYRPLCCGTHVVAGDAIALAKHYRDLGLSRLYIADLDAIESKQPQTALIRQILHAQPHCHEILIDIGWSGQEDAATKSSFAAIADEFPQSRWVAATESASSQNAMDQLADLVGAERLVLGLDYRGGRLVSPIADEPTWLDWAHQRGVKRILILDLQSVGTRSGAMTTEICRRVKQRCPDSEILSGGGIRCAQDVAQLIEAGCARCLVATALL